MSETAQEHHPLVQINMDIVKTPEGKVALVYYQPIPKMVKLGSDSIWFDCQHGISMAFVDEPMVTPLLEVLGGCCGNKRQIIFLANQAQYSHWKDGQGGR